MQRMLSLYPTYLIILTMLVIILFVGIVSLYLPFGDDWHHTFRPATRQLILGRSPYEVKTFLNPPWGLLPLAPIALLPENVGRAMLMLMALFAFAFTVYRLGAKPISLALFLLSPPAIQCFLTGNIDWMAMLGFVLPPRIGLLFVLIKPQIGGSVALFWLIESWRQDGLREVIKIFWPITVCLLSSMLIFGPWPLRLEQAPTFYWNASLWPMSIPVGLALLTAAVHKRRIDYAIGASPCLSPYLALQSWAGALATLVSSVPETIAAVTGLWVLVIIRVLG